MKNFLIYFRNNNLEVTHKIYVRARNSHNIVEAAKKILDISEYYCYDYIDYGQSKKKNISLIII